MDPRERGATIRGEKLVVVGIASLYAPIRNPRVREFRAGILEPIRSDIPPGATITSKEMEDRMLSSLGGDLEGKRRVLLRALYYARQVLIDDRSSPDRDERLHDINERLWRLTGRRPA